MSVSDVRGLDGQITRLTVPGTDEPSPTAVPEPRTYALMVGLTALGYSLLRHRRSIHRGRRPALPTERRSTGL